MAKQTPEGLKKLCDENDKAFQKRRDEIFQYPTPGGFDELNDMFKRHLKEEMEMAEAVYGKG